MSASEIEDVYFNFINSIKSQVTKKTYEGHVKKFMKHCGVSSFSDLLKIDEKQIIKYVMSMREQGLSYNTISVRLNAIFHFYAMNDVVLNKKKIKKFKGEFSRKVVDRAYTHQEISKILAVSDLRMKAIISLFACTGVRIQVIPELQMKHLQKVKNDIYKVTVYELSKDPYFTFTTPECTSFIDSYLDFRQTSGEKLDKDSYLIRDQFDITDFDQIWNRSKPIKYNTLKVIVGTVLIKAGLRTVDHTSSHNRKEVARAHGFRKFFTTQLVNSKINPEIREMLLGHKIGLASPYYRPTEQEMLDEYMKAVNNLTINEENRLKIKVESLERDKINYERLDAKIEALQRAFFKNNVKVDKDTKRQYVTLEPYEEYERPLTYEEIENEISWSRTKRKARRQSEQGLMQELQND